MIIGGKHLDASRRVDGSTIRYQHLRALIMTKTSCLALPRRS
jgi:hypothetical protein